MMLDSASRESIGSATMPTTPPVKNPHAVALGKLGASKGGLARAANLNKKRRAEIARKAANARWGARKVA
jgi:hypothetical protein